MQLKILNQTSRYLQQLSKVTKAKSSTILTGLAVCGTVSSVILTHIATKKAMRKMEEARSKEDYEEPQSKFEEAAEEVKETWTCYVPVAIVLVVTVVSEVQSNRINLRKIAILTDAYRMSENLRKEYQEKTQEVVGKTKEEKIRSEMAKDELADVDTKEDLVYNTGIGSIIFKDRFSGRLFYQDIEAMRQARNQLDSKLLTNDSANLNEWYYLIKIEPLDLVGDIFGWNIQTLDRKLLSGIEFIPSTTKNGVPCYLVTYDVELDYDRYDSY